LGNCEKAKILKFEIIVEGINIIWQAVIAVIGVVTGFILTEKILERKGLRRRRLKIKVGFYDLPDYLESRYLLQSAIIHGDRVILKGVSIEEAEEALKILEKTGCSEIVLISGSDFRYATRRGSASVYLRGKFVSMRDFSEVWNIVQSSLQEVS